MDGGLGLSQALEHGGGIGLHPLRQLRRLDHGQDMRQVTVLLGLDRANAELGGADAAAHGLLELKLRAGLKRRQALDDAFGAGARVGERAHQHVAADSGECVQVAESHGVD